MDFMTDGNMGGTYFTAYQTSYMDAVPSFSWLSSHMMRQTGLSTASYTLHVMRISEKIYVRPLNTA